MLEPKKHRYKCCRVGTLMLRAVTLMLRVATLMLRVDTCMSSGLGNQEGVHPYGSPYDPSRHQSLPPAYIL